MYIFFRNVHEERPYGDVNSRDIRAVPEHTYAHAVLHLSVAVTGYRHPYTADHAAASFDIDDSSFFAFLQSYARAAFPSVVCSPARTLFAAGVFSGEPARFGFSA